MSDNLRLSPSGLPWPPEWASSRGYVQLVSGIAVAVGVLFLLLAFSAWTESAPRRFGSIAAALFGLAVFLLPELTRIGRKRRAVVLGVRTVRGEEHRGAVFRVRRTFLLARPLFFVAVGAGTVTLTGADPPAGAGPILWGIGGGCLLLSLLPFLAGLGFQGIVLTPDLVIVRTGMHRTTLRLPWREIDRVIADEYESRGRWGTVPIPLVTLSILNASYLRLRWWPRFKYRYFGVRDAETKIIAAWFGVDPALLLLTLRHYLDHPGDRPELGNRRAIDRIKAGKFSMGDDQVW